jgi:hypothetical protein
MDEKVFALTPEVIAFWQGRTMFRYYKERPPTPPEKEFLGRCSLAALRWLGWMTERAIEWDCRRKLCMHLGGNPEEVQPRPCAPYLDEETGRCIR